MSNFGVTFSFLLSNVELFNFFSMLNQLSSSDMAWFDIGQRMLWIRGGYTLKVFSVDHCTSLLHDSIWSTSFSTRSFNIPHEVVFDSSLEGCKGFSSFFFGEVVLLAYVETSGDNVIFSSNIAISVKIITNVWNFLSSSFGQKLGLGHLLWDTLCLVVTLGRCFKSTSRVNTPAGICLSQ